MNHNRSKKGIPVRFSLRLTDSSCPERRGDEAIDALTLEFAFRQERQIQRSRSLPNVPSFRKRLLATMKLTLLPPECERYEQPTFSLLIETAR